ncbi:hypothetical protein [Nocardia noduli]|uniref:hypothetical protein n=1 Tax=Nocardia noduli TaxID=2815722 RepID=UPI001C23408B|nr:hypothetical protein [Nocardia noduli]
MSSTPGSETTTRAGRSTERQPTDRCLASSVTDVLDFFEKCPQCGYAAQATSTVRRYDSGRVVTLFHPTCAQPCGWSGTVRVTERQSVTALPSPNVAPTVHTENQCDGEDPGTALIA